MDKGGQESSLPTNGLVWLLALVAGLAVFKELPWRASRPAADEPRAFDSVGAQDVDARLWQDPFGAVARWRAQRAREAGAPGAPGAAGAAVGAGAGSDGSLDAGHDVAQMRREVEAVCTKSGTTVLPIGVMVSGGPYADYAEFRRRARYAALAGLHRAGFSPADAEHIGYFLPAPMPAAVPGGTAPAGESDPLPDFVAFEWLEERVDDSAAAAPDPVRDVAAAGPRPRVSPLLLWLDEDAFGRRPVEKLRHLVSSIVPDACRASRGSASGGAAMAGDAAAPGAATDRFLVIGPMASDVLSAIVRAPGGPAPLRNRALAQGAIARSLAAQAAGPLPPLGIAFYAYGATVPQERIERREIRRGACARRVGREDPACLPAAECGSPDAPDAQAAVMRTIGSDDRLAAALADELVLRRVLPCTDDAVQRGVAGCARLRGSSAATRHVVLVGERDGQYGQALSDTFADAFARDRTGGVERIHRFSYLRGLDGRAAAAGRADRPGGDAEGRGADDARSTSSGSPAAGSAEVERAEGQAQVDYLRRMAGQLATLEESLRSGNSGRIGAIGVLGTDVHDKLLILQALRARFPDAIFFTTDMDARLLHPSEIAATRNLLVVSSYGLSLHPALQGDVAAFRDGYQTAIFLSTMLAIGDALQGDCAAPARKVAAADPARALAAGATPEALPLPGRARVFEIGRTGVVEFDAATAAAEASGLPRATARPAVAAADDPPPWRPMSTSEVRCGLRALASVHPEVGPLHASLSDRTLRAALGLLALAVVAAAGFGGAIAAAGRFVAGPRLDDLRPARAALVMAAVLTVAVLVLLAFVHPQAPWRWLAGLLTRDGAGEPLGVLDGVSIWPTELLRAIALGLSIAFLARGWRLLKENEDEITGKLQTGPERDAMRAELERTRARWPWWVRLARTFAYRLPVAPVAPAPRSAADGRAVERDPAPGEDAPFSSAVRDFWLKYLYQGRGAARVTRVVAVTAVFLVCATAFLYLEVVPSTPGRGIFAQRVDVLLGTASVVCALLLVFFVVDATMVTEHFIRELHANPAGGGAGGRPASRWPPQVLRRYGRKFAIDEQDLDCLDYWVGTRFVALRTRAVVRLVWGPFVVLALLILSSSPFFDRWSVTTSLLVVVAGCVLIVLACAIRLRLSAEAFRRKAIWRLGNEVVRLRGSPDEARRRSAEQLQELIEQVRAFRAGAFAPYSQQPVLRAMLLPLSGLGGPVLVEQLGLWSL